MRLPGVPVKSLQVGWIPFCFSGCKRTPHWVGLEQGVLGYGKRRKCCTKTAERAK